VAVSPAPGRRRLTRPLAQLVREPESVYRPRHPERTALYRLFDRHFDAYARIHEERFERSAGPLRPVVPRAVEAYLDCGRLHGGFARLRCPQCRGEHLLAFSCQTRNFCPSCQAKRAALFAERLEREILAPVPHRPMVFTIPKALRGLFERERKLLGLLPRCAFGAVRRLYQEHVSRRDAVPGMVASIQTFGSALNFHPHVHALVTEGVLEKGGGFLPLAQPDLAALEELFRHVVLAELVRAERLSEGFRDKLLTWRHSGFSVYGAQVVLPEESGRLAHLARYATRPPLAQQRVQRHDERTYLLRTAPHPATGATQLELDPLELIHRLAQQIPDPRQHLVRYYGAYANRARQRYRPAAEKPDGGGAGGRGPDADADAEAGFANERRRSWARLLRKILEVDPLLCPRCQVEMKIVSVISDPVVIDAILRHVEEGGGHDPHAPRAPPAA